MYTTIEADIENGRITGAECINLPKQAHVLITLLSRPVLRDSYKAPQTPNREPDPALRGSIKILGNIMDSSSFEFWDLPT